MLSRFRAMEPMEDGTFINIFYFLFAMICDI